MGERGGHRNTAVSRDNLPSRPKCSGAKNGGGGGEGDEARKSEGDLMNVAGPSSTDVAGDLGGGQDSPSSFGARRREKHQRHRGRHLGGGRADRPRHEQIRRGEN